MNSHQFAITQCLQVDSGIWVTSRHERLCIGFALIGGGGIGVKHERGVTNSQKSLSGGEKIRALSVDRSIQY